MYLIFVENLTHFFRSTADGNHFQSQSPLPPATHMAHGTQLQLQLLAPVKRLAELRKIRGKSLPAARCCCVSIVTQKQFSIEKVSRPKIANLRQALKLMPTPHPASPRPTTVQPTNSMSCLFLWSRTRQWLPLGKPGRTFTNSLCSTLSQAFSHCEFEFLFGGHTPNKIWYKMRI